MREVANTATLSRAATLLSAADPVLGTIIKQVGIATITPHQNYYQELVESIISQQMSVKAAATILRRFIDLFDGHDFPSPTQILEKDIEQLRTAGLSRQKAGYILDLASKVIDGSVRFNHLDALPNDSVINELTRIKGVGVWTVHMFLIFCMGRLNVLPVGDLGIKNGIQRLYNLDHLPEAVEIEKIARANNWSPHESVASWYIWQSTDNTLIL
ncbi:MAG: DNA-3-methyladenine glycosylase [Candidatus Saccharibacteria bacterium]